AEDVRSRTVTWSDPARARSRHERGRTVFPVVADELHENPMSTMHGDIVATLVDTTPLAPNTNFVRSITQSTDRVCAEGRVAHSRGRVETTEAHVYDHSRTLFAHADSTCLVSRRTR